MSRTKKAVLVIAAIAGIALAATVVGSEPITIEVGKPFPDLRLPTLDGELRSLADFRGTKVVLHVFASW